MRRYSAAPLPSLRMSRLTWYCLVANDDLSLPKGMAYNFCFIPSGIVPVETIGPFPLGVWICSRRGAPTRSFPLNDRLSQHGTGFYLVPPGNLLYNLGKDPLRRGSVLCTSGTKSQLSINSFQRCCRIYIPNVCTSFRRISTLTMCARGTRTSRMMSPDTQNSKGKGW